MLYTLQPGLTIDFDVKYSTIEERHIPVNITEYSPTGEYRPIELTVKQYDKLMDYLQDYEGEEEMVDRMSDWLFGPNFLEKY